MSAGPPRCATCGAPLAGAYCSQCGERRLGPHDYEFGHFAGEALESFTHADGKIFNSLRLLLTRPGRLTAEFLAGRRKPYLKPLSLFLVANTAYFLIQPLFGWDTLSTSLHLYLHDQPYSWLVRAIFERRFAAGETVPPDYVRSFNAHGVLLAKSLVLVMVPLFSLAVWAFEAGARRRYLEHFIFALHFYAFWLLYLAASLGLTTGLLRLLGPRVWTSHAAALDWLLVLTGYLVFTLYLYPAIRAVYGGSRPAGLTKAAALALCVLPVLQVYRLFLFLLTYYTL